MPSGELTLCLAKLHKQPDDQTYADPHGDHEKDTDHYASGGCGAIIAAAFARGRPRRRLLMHDNSEQRANRGSSTTGW